MHCIIQHVCQIQPVKYVRELLLVSQCDLAGTSGPEFCGSEREEEAFCNGARNREDRSCDSDQVCTSSCQCWDGTSVREADIMEFTGVGIKDQGTSVADMCMLLGW